MGVALSTIRFALCSVCQCWEWEQLGHFGSYDSAYIVFVHGTSLILTNSIFRDFSLLETDQEFIVKHMLPIRKMWTKARCGYFDFLASYELN